MTFVLLYSIVGFYLDFTIEQLIIRSEIKEKIINNLPENELSLIKISTKGKDNIRWTEESKEFKFNGNMYDIVKCKTIHDTTYYYCFNDDVESKLLLNLDKLVKEQSNNSKSNSITKKQVITFFILPQSFAQNLEGNPLQYYYHSIDYSSVVKDVLSPPPRKRV